MKLTDAQKRLHEADLRMQRNFSGFNMGMFSKVLQFQKEGCAICGRKRSKYLRLSLDHSHRSGQIRGCLCWQCNKALAAFNDNPVLFAMAAQYLLNPPVSVVFGKDLYTLPGRVDTKKRRKLVRAMKEQHEKTGRPSEPANIPEQLCKKS
jgi:hypothetical protein